ncbi:MAG: hypothetical protein LBH06_00785 [Rikenellaceae bacterium]|jgi:hypothetical protein|nr:hypothetical protein [Rikenellaceae bacterium]
MTQPDNRTYRVVASTDPYNGSRRVGFWPNADRTRWMRVEEKGVTLDEALRKLETIAANMPTTDYHGPDTVEPEDFDTAADYAEYCRKFPINGYYDSDNMPDGDAAAEPVWVPGQTSLRRDTVIYTIEEEG